VVKIEMKNEIQQHEPKERRVRERSTEAETNLYIRKSCFLIPHSEVRRKKERKKEKQ
jgi:hypothetical protein